MTPLAYATKTRYRVTLDIEVYDDFDPFNVDFAKLLDIQGNETCQTFVEDMTHPTRW